MGTGYRIETGSNLFDLEPVLPIQTFHLKGTGSKPQNPTGQTGGGTRRRAAPFPWGDCNRRAASCFWAGRAAKTRGMQAGPQSGRRTPIAATLRAGIGIIATTGDADSFDIFDIFD